MDNNLLNSLIEYDNNTSFRNFYPLGKVGLYSMYRENIS